MHIERKLTTIALVVVGLTAGLAFAQVSPRGGGSGGAQGPGGSAAGSQASLNLTPMQQALSDMIGWKQSTVLQGLGGEHPNYDALSTEVKSARMEVIRACNLYSRAMMNSAQQAEYDRSTLDPVKHPLPAKWENMRQQGTMVSALLKSDKAQEKKAAEVLETFRSRQSAIWGQGNNGGYAKNLELLVKDFRAILTPAQTTEFNKLWNSYLSDINAAVRTVRIAQ